MNMPELPKDIGGYQQVVVGPVKPGDIWVNEGRPQAFVTDAFVNVETANATLQGWSVYRKIPQPGHHQPEVVAKLAETGHKPSGSLLGAEMKLDELFHGRVRALTYLTGDKTSTQVVVASESFIPQGDGERKSAPMFRGLLAYFPAALFGVAKHSYESDRKHNPDATDGPHWARGKSSDHADCQIRHLIDAGGGEINEPDTEYHLRANAWRALALYQEYLEKYKGARPGVRSVNKTKGDM